MWLFLTYCGLSTGWKSSFLGGVFCFYNVVGALDEGVDLGVGDVAVEVELYPVSKALIERVAHR